MSSRRRVLLPLTLALLLVLAGCAGNAPDSEDAAQSGDSAGGEPSASEPSDEDRRSALQVRERAIVRTGNVTLETTDFDAARGNLTSAVRARGGYVSDSNQRIHRSDDGTWTTGRVVFRVPSEEFPAFLDDVKAEGEVQESDTGTEDVTDRLVDIDARLENLRFQRDRLRDLYENASDTGDVLAVQKRLSEVQSDIERLEAKTESLEERVAYSTATVELREPRPGADAESASQRSWYDTGVLAAFLDSTSGAIVMLRAMVVGAAYLVPYLAVLAVPAVGGYGLWRRGRRGPLRARTGDERKEGSGDGGGDGSGDEGDSEDA